MNIIIQSRSETPIYEQIYEQISAQILSGELPPDFALPSIRTLSKDLGVSVITVKKAWELLDYNGFIYSRQGIGCFVAAHAHKKLEDKKISLAKERLAKELEYYKGLGLSIEELIELIKKLY